MNTNAQGIISALALIFVLASCVNPKNISKAPAGKLEDMLKGRYAHLDSCLGARDSLRIQVIFTRIDRTAAGKPVFTDYHLGVDTGVYFYPASAIKFPVAVLALEKLRELKIPGLDARTMMITEAEGQGQTRVYNDPSSSNGSPSVDHYIRKILLVSDNDAFNRLYEFLGQQYINDRFAQLGYPGVQVLHRLSVSLSESQNRWTNPVRFLDTAGNVVYSKPALNSELIYTPRNTKLGQGYVLGKDTVYAPFDFSRKNRFYLSDFHQVMRSVIFPSSVPARQRFKLTPEDYSFLYRYLSMHPLESVSPVYDSIKFKDVNPKLLSPAGAFDPKSGIRVYSKAGGAYGFLTDVAYVHDSIRNVEFMLSATIYCNADGILNDDRYDYEQTGYPFFRELFQLIYEQELSRKRTAVHTGPGDIHTSLK